MLLIHSSDCNQLMTRTQAAAPPEEVEEVTTVRKLPHGGKMVCTTCGSVRFVSTECKMSEGPAPAFECVECHALYLNERAVGSEA